MKYVGRGDKFEKEISRLKWNGMIAMVWIPIAEPRDLLIICPITPEICQDFDIKFEPSESCILFRLPLSMTVQYLDTSKY
ncbi:hypothetical protein G9A89_007346 [Geosiphon pyriformis]|nr:hypothetical protein G9A89_007346 [Geosiphon pyriformis]